MRQNRVLPFLIAALALLCGSVGFSGNPQGGETEKRRYIVTSDTILSGMIASLLPPHRYKIDAILPPGQCPGHYDVKFSDLEKLKRADLVVAFKGMPSMIGSTADWGGTHMLVDAGDRNWMAPDAYLYGLDLMAARLSKRFPDDEEKILSRRDEAVRGVRRESNALVRDIRRTGLFGKSVIASSMQKESLEWMGFRVAGVYGRPEAMSAREIARLVKLGREHRAVAVVDNLQSGPDAGKGIAETLKIPHVVLSNYPSEKGYLATLRENLDILTARVRK